jgi:predicted phage terminase large subunit-like protein
MADPRVMEIFDGLSRAQIAAIVDRLAPQHLVALAEELPRAQTRVDVAAGTPADFAAALDPGYRRPAHVEALSTAIAETVAAAVAGDPSVPHRLIVSMPPRVGKSWTSSLWTPAWFLERYPERSVILASHDGNYAVSWGRKVRDTLRRNEPTLQVRLARGVGAAGEWETTAGGGMLARGIGGSITGRGGHLLLIDDPIKDFATAHSLTVRQAQWDWWLSTAQTRLETPAAVVVVMTRWHEDDLAGRLTSAEWEGDPDEWRVLRIPALGEGAVDDVAAGKVAPDALARDAGVPLTLASTDEDPDAAAARWAKIRRGVGPYVFAGLYQQRPSEPEGTILRRGWWQFYRRIGDQIVRPDGSRVALTSLRIVQSWDLAVKGKASSDYVVGQVWGALGSGDRFLLDQFHDRADFVATKTAMRAMRAKWPTTAATFIEDKANGPAVISDLRSELSGLIPDDPVGDKVQRAYGIQGDLEAGSLWLPVPEEAGFDVRGFIQEAAEFPNGAHDDRVDALTQAILRLRTSRLDVGRPTRPRPSGTQGRVPTTRRTIRRA